MALVLKKRNRGVRECAYGCCTTVYGKHVRSVRRSIKRRENAAVRREISQSYED